MERRARSNRQPDTDFVHALLDRIKCEIPVAVVHGGDRSVEGAVIRQTRNPRSDKSYELVARDIANALLRLGFKHVELIPEDMRLGERLKQSAIGLVWLNSGGTQGFSSTCHASSMLELFGVPYIGHNPMNAALLDNKHTFKYVMNGLLIDTPEFLVCDFKSRTEIDSVVSRFDQTFHGYGQSFVVKPVSGRASHHVHCVEGKAAALETARQVHLATGNLVLIERFLPGAEYTIAVNGPLVSVNRQLTQLEGPFAFSAIRRVMDEDELIFTSMDVKPIGPDRFHVLDPDVDSGEVDALSAIAEKIYNGCDLETLVRIDIRADQNGRLYVLEANPKPDLKQPSTSGFSLVSAGLGLCGMDYDDLILSILASRIHFLLTHRRDMIPQIADLLE